VDSELAFFKKNENKRFCVSVNGKALCLMYTESIALLKEYNFARHCNSKHKEKFKSCAGALRREKVTALKRP
jgi:hypothetical protein